MDDGDILDVREAMERLEMAHDAKEMILRERVERLEKALARIVEKPRACYCSKERPGWTCANCQTVEIAREALEGKP